jgi:Cilia- and flagella-associated protein 69, ARM repeat
MPKDQPITESKTLTESLDYEKLCGVFTHRYTSSVYSRQVAALRRVARHREAGFTYSELSSVHMLMQLALERVLDGNIVFNAPFCALLSLLQIAPRVDEPLADSTKLSLQSDTLQLLSYCFDERCAVEVRMAALQCLDAFLRYQSTTPTMQTQAELLSVSCILDSVVNACIHARQSVESRGVFEAAIACVWQASFHSECVDQLIESAFIPEFIESLSAQPACSESSVIFQCIETLWNLHSVDMRVAAYIAEERGIVDTLHRILGELLYQGYRDRDRELRNFILCFIQSLLRDERTSVARSIRRMLTHVGLVDTLVLQAFYTEAPWIRDMADDIEQQVGISPVQPELSQLTNNLDFEFKQMCWMLIGELSTDMVALARISKARPLKALAQYLCNATVQDRWCWSKLAELQSHALTLITELAPRLPAQFEQDTITAVCMRFARSSLALQDDYSRNSGADADDDGGGDGDRHSHNSAEKRHPSPPTTDRSFASNSTAGISSPRERRAFASSTVPLPKQPTQYEIEQQTGVILSGLRLLDIRSHIVHQAEAIACLNRICATLTQSQSCVQFGIKRFDASEFVDDESFTWLTNQLILYNSVLTHMQSLDQLVLQYVVDLCTLLSLVLEGHEAYRLQFIARQGVQSIKSICSILSMHAQNEQVVSQISGAKSALAASVAKTSSRNLFSRANTSDPSTPTDYVWHAVLALVKSVILNDSQAAELFCAIDGVDPLLDAIDMADDESDVKITCSRIVLSLSRQVHDIKYLVSNWCDMHEHAQLDESLQSLVSS